MDFKELAGNLGLEEGEFLELVELFIEKGGSDLDMLQSALDQGDTEKILEAAHSIKGASGNLGFMEIYEVAKNVELNARNQIIDGTPGALQLMRRGIDLISAETTKP